MIKETFEITERFMFEAAHFVPKASNPKLAKMHGHSHFLFVTLAGTPTAPFGWVVESSIFRASVQEFVDILDHSILNDTLKGKEIIGTTGEALCFWFWQKLSKRWGPLLRKVEIEKAHGLRVSYSGGKKVVGYAIQ